VFTFSDGSQAVLDYTGNTVTGISKLMVEFDPSYQWGNVRAWGSVRYDSRQYVSRTNLASFSGHFETFAGADWKITRSHSLSLSFVNLLMQSGAKGSIDIADTIDDRQSLTAMLWPDLTFGPLLWTFLTHIVSSFRDRSLPGE